jgi:hypothetical protein
LGTGGVAPGLVPLNRSRNHRLDPERIIQISRRGADERGDADHEQIKRAGDQLGNHESDADDRPPPIRFHRIPPVAAYLERVP